MNIRFSTTRLQKLANNYKICQKEMGITRSKLFNKRLTDLLEADSLEAVRYMPGKYHELTANRKGQWACDIGQPYRLIFKPCKDPIPKNKDGQYLWLEIEDIEVMEIVDYH